MLVRSGVTHDHEQCKRQVQVTRRGVRAPVSGESNPSLLCFLDGCVHEVDTHGTAVDLARFCVEGGEGCEVLVVANEWGRVRACMERNGVLYACVGVGVGGRG